MINFCFYIKAWFTACWNSLFILFKFHYLAKDGILEFGFLVFQCWLVISGRGRCYLPQKLKQEWNSGISCKPTIICFLTTSTFTNTSLYIKVSYHAFLTSTQVKNKYDYYIVVKKLFVLPAYPLTNSIGFQWRMKCWDHNKTVKHAFLEFQHQAFLINCAFI